MSFTSLKTNQNTFLEKHLRGTDRAMSAAQAKETYGIQNLSARISELRQAGMVVRKSKNTAGNTAYSVSRRDLSGSQGKIFA